MATTFTLMLSVPLVTPSEIYATSIILPFLGTFFVLLRFYARALQKKALKKKMTGIDDWLMLLALILVKGMGICLIILVGVQRKAIAYSTISNEYLTREEQFTYLNPTVKTMGMIQYAIVILLILAFGTIKLSVTFYYRRMFVIAKGLCFDWITKAAIAIVVLWTVGFLFACIFICGTHFLANWSSALNGSKYCDPSFHVNSAFAVTDLITDVMVLCMSLPVWPHERLKTVGALLTEFLFGSIVASIIRGIISFEMRNTHANYDPNLIVSTVLHWSMIEGGLAVIAACLPTLRFLVSKVSLSGILHSLRSILAIGSIHTQQKEQQQQQFQESPPHPKESHTHIHTGPSSFPTSDTAREKNQNPVNMGEMNESQENGIQVTRQFSQHVSMV